MNDVRFLSVAPHWYFRPYMAWLTVCPFHEVGLFGVLYFFFILFFQPTIHGTSEYVNYNIKTISTISEKVIYKNNVIATKYISIEDNLTHQIAFWFFSNSSKGFTQI